MVEDTVLVRLRHQLPGHSAGECVSYRKDIAARLVDELYAVYVQPEDTEQQTSDQQPAGSSEGEQSKQQTRRRRKQMDARGQGSSYATK